MSLSTWSPSSLDESCVDLDGMVDRLAELGERGGEVGLDLEEVALGAGEQAVEDLVRLRQPVDDLDDVGRAAARWCRRRSGATRSPLSMSVRAAWSLRVTTISTMSAAALVEGAEEDVAAAVEECGELAAPRAEHVVELARALLRAPR